MNNRGRVVKAHNVVVLRCGSIRSTMGNARSHAFRFRKWVSSVVRERFHGDACPCLSSMVTTAALIIDTGLHVISVLKLILVVYESMDQI